MFLSRNSTLTIYCGCVCAFCVCTSIHPYERTGDLALELVALLAAGSDSIIARQLSITTALVDVALFAAQKSITAEEPVGDSQAVA